MAEPLPFCICAMAQDQLFDRVCAACTSGAGLCTCVACRERRELPRWHVLQTFRRSVACAVTIACGNCGGSYREGYDHACWPA